MTNWRELNRKGLISLVLPEYKINKLLMNLTFFLMVFIILAAAGVTSFEANYSYYLKCEGLRVCENPYYRAAVCPPGFECSREFLNPGEAWGVAPSPVYSYAGLLCFLSLIIGLLANHFIYNRGYDFKTRFKELSEEA